MTARKYTFKRILLITSASTVACVLGVLAAVLFMLLSLLGWTSAVEFLRETLMRFAAWYDKEVLG